MALSKALCRLLHCRLQLAQRRIATSKQQIHDELVKASANCAVGYHCLSQVLSKALSDSHCRLIPTNAASVSSSALLHKLLEATEPSILRDVATELQSLIVNVALLEAEHSAASFALVTRGAVRS